MRSEEEVRKRVERLRTYLIISPGDVILNADIRFGEWVLNDKGEK